MHTVVIPYLVDLLSFKNISFVRVGVPEVPCAFSVGGVGVGEIAGLSSVGLELVYSPTTPSQERSEFIVTFSHPSVPPVSVLAVQYEQSTITVAPVLFSVLML